MEVAARVVEKHCRPDWIGIGKAGYEHPYSLVVPYPSTLKVGQLCLALVYARKDFLQSLAIGSCHADIRLVIEWQR